MAAETSGRDLEPLARLNGTLALVFLAVPEVQHTIEFTGDHLKTTGAFPLPRNG
jgi:hypothetical protein